MKKKFIYVLVAFIFVFATGFIILKTKGSKPSKEISGQLLSRNESLSIMTDWKEVQAKAASLTKRIKDNPNDIKSLLAITALFVNEGRITGNLGYYNNEAMKYTETVLTKDPNNFEALTFKSMILLSQHRFEEGLSAAQFVQTKYPYNAFVYGLIVDANVELGNYTAALDAADKMISIRPDLRSYSRIAYLREIHGDIPGAIDAMKLAIGAGSPGDENTEWSRVQMAKLYEQLGNAKEAAMHYSIAVENRQYPYAVAGLAGIAVAEKQYEKALTLYQQAIAMMPDHIFKEGMIEVYELTGETAKADAMAKEILKQMKELSSNKSGGQNEDHEMAHAWMGVKDYDKALEYAIVEYKRRPANIEVNETVAIVYYNKGEFSNALPYIETALKTNCQNPELLCRAGLIYAKTGDKAKAKKILTAALEKKPLIPQSLKQEAMEMLESI